MKTFTLIIVLLISGVLACQSITVAQPSTPPPPPSSHGTNGNQGPGGFAPIGGGIELLFIFGAGYALARSIKKKRHP